MKYTNENRGKIQYKDKARQIIDFSGIRYKNITPTDIDGLIEYHDKAVIICEMKFAGSEMPTGQRIALERVADDILKAGKESVIFLCQHFISDWQKDINASETIVTAIYWHGKWNRGNGYRLSDQITKYLQWIDNTPF